MEEIKNLGKRLFVRPIARIFIALNIHPNLITITSFLFAVIAFFIYRAGIFWLGGIVLFLSSIFDTFDGEVARQTQRMTNFGGFLDSTIDRINEFLIFLGLFFFYYSHSLNYVILWIFLAFFGSMMVSYTRARAEGLNISPRVGIFERLVRSTLLIIGSFLGKDLMVYFLAIIAIGSIITAIQRIFYVHQNSIP